jgi:hypothetical protein
MGVVIGPRVPGKRLRSFRSPFLELAAMTGNLPGQHFVAELAGASSNNSPTVISLFPLSFKWEKAGGKVFFSPQLFGPAGREEKRKGEKKKEREREYPTRYA